MANQKHTPGPWKYDEQRCAIVSLARWFTEPEDDCSGEGVRLSIVDLYGAMGGENTGADARLIAAAPELLEALEAFLSANHSVGLREGNAWEHNEAEKIAVAAIKKAKIDC